MKLKETTKIKETTIAVILYKSKILANGEHPLALRITKDRKRKYKYLKISCNPKMWDSSNNKPKSNHPDKELLNKVIADTIAEYRTKILELSTDGKGFTADSLMLKVENPTKISTVFNFFDEIIARNIQAKKIGNAGVYSDCKGCLKKFLKNNDVTFSDINNSFLCKWEAFQRGNGNFETTLSTRFRTLRSLFNKAILENVAKTGDYPFNDFKISKFDTSTKKRAIKIDDIKKIEALDIEGKTMLKIARQYFLFSYYGLGINFIDIANLRWSNIIDGRVFYNRQKTGGKEISFKLNAPLLNIINIWKPITGAEVSNYVFQILDNKKHITPIQIDNRVHKVLGTVNRSLKEIGNKIGLTIPLTTYVARHSMASVMKSNGVSTSVISQVMNHKTEEITKVYLQNFENKIIDDAQSSL